MDASITRVREEVTSIIRSRGSILGSQLGSLIRDLAPALNLKEDYGNLRSFVAANLAGIAVLAGKHGGDDIYTASGASTSSGSAWRPLPKNSRFLWQAFSNPTSSGVIAADPALGELYSSLTDAAVPANCTIIAKLSPEDYREIARGYLPQLGDQGDEFLKILENDDFWPIWHEAIKKLNAHESLAQWERWRISRVTAEFERRLVEVGMHREAIAKWVTVLSDSRTTPARVSPSVDSVNQQADSIRRSITDIARAAVSNMSEDELRRLRLPLGAVLDALTKR